MDLPMDRLETVLGTQSPTKGATVNLFMEGLAPTQETNMDLSMDRQVTVLGTQSPT